MKKYTFNEILSYVGSTYEIAGHEENNWFDKVMPLPEGDENSLVRRALQRRRCAAS